MMLLVGRREERLDYKNLLPKSYQFTSGEAGVLFTKVCMPVSVHKFCICKFLCA